MTDESALMRAAEAGEAAVVPPPDSDRTMEADATLAGDEGK